MWSNMVAASQSQHGTWRKTGTTTIVPWLFDQLHQSTGHWEGALWNSFPVLADCGNIPDWSGFLAFLRAGFPQQDFGDYCRELREFAISKEKFVIYNSFRSNRFPSYKKVQKNEFIFLFPHFPLSFRVLTHLKISQKPKYNILWLRRSSIVPSYMPIFLFHFKRTCCAMRHCKSVSISNFEYPDTQVDVFSDFWKYVY